MCGSITVACGSGDSDSHARSQSTRNPEASPVIFSRRTPDHRLRPDRGGETALMIRKLKSGEYRLYSRKKDPRTGKRRNLGTFKTRAAAERHERAVQFFKRRG